MRGWHTQIWILRLVGGQKSAQPNYITARIHCHITFWTQPAPGRTYSHHALDMATTDQTHGHNHQWVELTATTGWTHVQLRTGRIFSHYELDMITNGLNSQPLQLDTTTSRSNLLLPQAGRVTEGKSLPYGVRGKGTEPSVFGV